MKSIVTVLALFLLPLAVLAQGPFPPVNQLPSISDLPDPLVMFDGTPVTSAEQWYEERRPELKALFEHYMYGYAADPPNNFQTSEIVNKQIYGGSATLKVVRMEFGPSSAPHVDLLVIIPNSDGPSPVIIYPNQSGNHGVHPDPDIPLTEAGGWFAPANDSQRGQAQFEGFAWETVLGRGYALATIYVGEISPDQPGFNYGVHPHYFPDGTSSPGHHEWAAIAAWAWGVHRVVDYLVTDPDIDSDKIGVTGWSRTGKSALLAGAFDERIAVTAPIQSGTGGAGPSRNLGYGPHESVNSINSNFSYWFSGAFKDFNHQTNRLPFDQHSLVAMTAPRAVVVLHATNDPYSHPRAEFDVLVAASAVHDFLGIEGISTTSYPSQHNLIDSRIGFWRRSGGHGVGTSEWGALLDFADIHMKGSAPPVQVDGESSFGTEIKLEGAYPNPFRDQVRVAFSVPSSGNATLRVFDILGREVGTFFEGHLPEGRHELSIPGAGLPAAIYSYRLEWNGQVKSGLLVRQ